MSLVRFTRDHEWIRLDGDFAVVGITDYAQSQLGDVVYVELPEVGKRVEKGKEAAVVESVKAASEVYAPVSGEVVAVNEALSSEPAKINADALGEGWFLKIRMSDPKQLDGLMDEAAYQKFVAGLGGAAGPAHALSPAHHGGPPRHARRHRRAFGREPLPRRAQGGAARSARRPAPGDGRDRGRARAVAAGGEEPRLRRG